MATDHPCTPPGRLPPASRVLPPRRTPWHPQVGSQPAAQIGLGSGCPPPPRPPAAATYRRRWSTTRWTAWRRRPAAAASRRRPAAPGIRGVMTWSIQLGPATTSPTRWPPYPAPTRPYLAPIWPRCRNERGAVSRSGRPQRSVGPARRYGHPCRPTRHSCGQATAIIPPRSPPPRNATTWATAPGRIAADVTLAAGIWRIVFTAAATERQLAQTALRLCRRR